MQIRVTPSGIMDKDTDLAYVNQGNYIDANDIRHRQTDGSTFGGVMSVAGNKQMLAIPSYSASTKTFRIYVDLSKIADGSVASNEGDLYLQNSAGTVYSNLTLNITGTVIAPYITTLKGFFNTLSNAAYGGLFTYSATTITGTYTAYFDITTALDTDFILRVNNTNYELCTIKLKNEYYATGGDFKVIGSQQLQDYLFVWLAGTVVSSGITSEVSEIGVVYTIDGGSTYSYQRLLRSKKMGFSTERRVEAEIERNGDEVNLYWTDGFNKPRAMYLKYSLITTQDAFLFISGGRYELETIDGESSFFYKSPSAYFEKIEVLESGGSLTSGNKRYSGRFLTEDFVSTDFLYPTNPVNIYSASLFNATELQGDEENVITKKSVRLTVKNFDPGIYKYFELVVLEYIGITFTSKIVQRFEINNEANEITVEHIGIGQDNILLSNQELLAITSKYLTTQNLKIFDNRVVMSNLVEQTDYNLSTWSENIKHSVCETYLTGVKIASNEDNTEPGLAIGEYQIPNNVLEKVGYMYNDTYRFAVQVQWKNTGKWSSPYWIDDIKIDNSPSNIIGSRRKTFGGIVSSVNTGTETITVTNHGFYDGQPVYFSATTIGGLSANTIYYILNSTTNTFQLSSTFGSSAVVNLTSSGTGTILDKKIDTNLTNIDATLTKAYYVRFFNIDLDFLVDTDGSGTGDTYLRDLIAGYRITRSERIPEVIATGDFFVSSTAISPGPTIAVPDGMSNDRAIPGGAANTQKLFFWSPDFYFGKSYSYESQDEIKILAPPDRTNMKQVQGVAEGDSVEYNTVLPVGPLEMKGQFADFPGYFVDPMTTTLNFQTFLPSGHLHLELGSSGQIGTNKYSIGYSDTVGLRKTISYRATEIFEMGSVIPAFSAPIASNEFGFYYGQIYRNLGGNEKYPINKEQTLYEGTGHFYFLSNGQNGIINADPVFGGDVFNQKSYTLLRMGSYSNIGANPRSAATMGSAMGFYSQNVSNLQMINVPDNDGTFDGPGHHFPQSLDKSKGGTFGIGTWGSGVCYWIEQWPEVSNQQNYNKGYDIVDNSILENGYNTNITYNGSLPSRITWSAKKVIGSQKDNYRIFKPIDFADLDLTLGPIVHHDIVNAALYTWQPYSVQRQYFREASLISAQDGSDVVVGSGSILGAPGQELTAIGADYKWNVIKGNTPNGKESAYWFSNRLKKFVRFGQDGNRVISDKGLISYLQNNTRFLEYYPYPLSGQGIHAVWNDKYSEAIFSFKGKNPSILTWEIISYAVGDYVFISPLSTYVHASGLPYAYKCKLNHTASASTKPETGANWQTYWTKITPGTDSYSHTLFTIVYDEIKNGFITFHSYWPDIYLKYKSIFWSPNPIDPEKLYLHDNGLESDYYGTYYPPTITAVMNYEPNVSKNFEALQFVTDKQPFDVYLTTPTHISYLDETEFEKREDLWYSPIKNDSTISGLNNGDTSRLWGKWLKVKISLESSSAKQKLINFIVKFRTMARLYNQ